MQAALNYDQVSITTCKFQPIAANEMKSLEVVHFPCDVQNKLQTKSENKNVWQ